LTFPASQPHRKSNLPGGSTAKALEFSPQKSKLKTARRGDEFFAARPAGLVFGNSSL
jgi:hypothetical protein